jgi:hypothetical protein
VVEVCDDDIYIKYYKYPKEEGRGFTQNEVKHACEVKDIVKKLQPPVPIGDKSNRRSPRVFEELAGIYECDCP